jgi:DNA-binding NarL/FixJ family response regulator
VGIEPVTCVVADDHPAILQTVRSFLELEEDIAVIGEASRGDEALARIEALRPAVAVLDVRMPGLDGIEVARRAGVSTPETAAVLYTGYGDRGLVSDALDAGVRGYVLKEAPLEDLLRAIKLVARGSAYVDAALGTALVGGLAVAGTPQLTDREREVVRLLAAGLRDAEIGRRLSISPDTVRTHVRNLTAKLDAETRTQAVATALRQSLIS